MTFKHCLLPVWVANYRYHEKLFQILINGRTGKVSGERPYSFWKIFSLVAAIVLVVGFIITLVMTMQKSSALRRIRPRSAARSRREPTLASTTRRRGA